METAILGSLGKQGGHRTARSGSINDRILATSRPRGCHNPQRLVLGQLHLRRPLPYYGANRWCVCFISGSSIIVFEKSQNMAANLARAFRPPFGGSKEGSEKLFFCSFFHVLTIFCMYSTWGTQGTCTDTMVARICKEYGNRYEINMDIWTWKKVIARGSVSCRIEPSKTSFSGEPSGTVFTPH